MKTTICLGSVILIEPTIFNDSRGSFFESYNSKKLSINFVQDNVSVSKQNVLRGLHYQLTNTQGKLVSCLKGMIYDVVVDLRKDSPTFKQYFGVILSERNHKQIYIPPAHAHGFLALDEENIVHYKCTDYYNPESQRTLMWNDSTINIKWPVKDVILSEKDRTGNTFEELQAKNELF